ncbi:MAG: cytochrome c556 [Candidatus Endobugula sp.]|jgi:cytochrome c556
MNKFIVVGCFLLVCASGFYFFISQGGGSQGTPLAQSGSQVTSTVENIDVSDVIKQRIALKQSLQQSANLLRVGLMSPVTIQGASRNEDASIIRAGLESMLELFPEGSLSNTSKATPTIWEDWDTFKSLLDQTIDVAKELENALADTPADRSPLGSDMNRFGAVGNPLIRQGVATNAPNSPIANNSLSGGVRSMIPAGPSYGQNHFSHPGLPGAHPNRGFGGFGGNSAAIDQSTTLIFFRMTHLCAECHNRFVERRDVVKAEKKSP